MDEKGERRRSAWVVFLLLLMGGAMLWVLVRPERGWMGWAAVGTVGLAVALPGTRALLVRLAEAARRTPAGVTAGALFAGALAYLAGAALGTGVHLGQVSHDAASYLLGARLMASGRLWTEAPGVPEAFESFHILTSPVYASIYPPGTSLLHVPGVMLGVPAWVTAMLLAAACVPAVYLLLRRLLGEGDLALAGALLVLGGGQLRLSSTAVMSQVPALLFGTLALLAAAAYRDAPSRWRAVWLGAAGGMLTILRPQDAAYVLPAALMIGLGALRGAGGIGVRPFAGHVMVAFLAAMPLLSLTVAHNFGTTGSPLRTAYWAYTRDSQPGTGFLSHTASAAPATAVVQKAEYNEVFGGIYRRQREAGAAQGVAVPRASMAVRAALPSQMLVVLIPLGVAALAMRHDGRAVLVALVGYGLIYGLFTFYLSHYVVPVAGLLAAVVVAGPLMIGRAFPVAGGMVRAGLLAAAGALLVAVSPVVNSAAVRNEPRIGDLAFVDEAERSLPRRPAILLVRYTVGGDFHQEPVYNLRHARIDDHDVIRAHDLGPAKNLALFRDYVARGEAGRRVYLADRATKTVSELGTAGELAAGRVRDEVPAPGGTPVR